MKTLLTLLMLAILPAAAMAAPIEVQPGLTAEVATVAVDATTTDTTITLVNTNLDTASVQRTIKIWGYTFTVSLPGRSGKRTGSIVASVPDGFTLTKLVIDGVNQTTLPPVANNEYLLNVTLQAATATTPAKMVIVDRLVAQSAEAPVADLLLNRAAMFWQGGQMVASAAEAGK